MKFITSLFASLLFVSFGSVYSSTISGKIIDSATKAPLEFVNVVVYKDSSKVSFKGITSKLDGSFTIDELPNGKYRVTISFVGYTNFSKKIILQNESFQLGEIRLKEDSKALKELEVMGQGSQMKFDVDKRIFTVDQNIATAGGSATDVLRNIPSVKVDNEGNISLRKDGNVEVWINGKPSGLTVDNRAQVLEQLPAGSIESIEIMTNPSAKFNPEGSAGIINLVMKKDRKGGYYGSVNAGVMYPLGGELGKSLGANINYSNSKIDTYLNIGYREMVRQSGGTTQRYNNESISNADTLLDIKNESSRKYGGVFVRTGLDYHIDKKNTIGISGFGMDGDMNSNSSKQYLLSNAQAPTILFDNYSRGTISIGTRPSYSVNLDYRHDFDKKGNNLLASLSYSKHERDFINTTEQKDSLANLQSKLVQGIGGQNAGWTFKVDYTAKPTESSRFETGMQSSISNSQSSSWARDSLLHLDIPEYRNVFDYQEIIHAGYVTYGDRFDKLSVQVGLRGEYLMKESNNTTASMYTGADTTQHINMPSSLQWFPSMYLSYSLPNNNELQLNFSRRINRPRGRRINPFKDFSDSTSISYGNPSLTPEYASALEFNYLKTWENQSLSTSAYYRFTDNVIEDVRFRNRGTMESTYMNIAKRTNTGLELISKNRLLKLLNLTSTLNFYYSAMDESLYTNPYDATSTTIIPALSTFAWSANVLANIMLSKTFSAQITGEYSSPTLEAQGIEGSEYQVDFGFRKTFFERKLNISLTMSDIFDFNRERTELWGNGFRQISVEYAQRRMIGLTASYNFGNMKPKQTEGKKKEGVDLNVDGGLD